LGDLLSNERGTYPPAARKAFAHSAQGQMLRK